MRPEDRPSDVAALYGQVPDERSGPAYTLVGPLRRFRDRERLAFLRDLPRGARIHEVGSGDGRLLAALAKAGYEAAGSDPWRHPRVNVPEDVRVDRRRIEELDLPPMSIDALVLWHVLEHLENPGEALSRTSGWLADEGRLVVAVPNLASLQAAIGGDRWFHQDVPRHLVHFTPAGIEHLLRRTGYAPTRIHHLVVEQNVLGMWQTLLNLLTRDANVAYGVGREHRSASRYDLLASCVFGPVLLPVAFVFELAAASVRRGGTIVVEARVS